MPRPLLFCSKSAWWPPIRREHSWAALAARAGHSVSFIERPQDVRLARDGRPREWAAGLVGRGGARTLDLDLRVRERSTLVPGHRFAWAARLDAALLGSLLARESSPQTSIVCSWPWDWPAVRSAPAHRRVFDMADDWGGLMPGRSERFARYYEQIAAEADEIVVVNPALAQRFGGRRPVLVRNGVADEMLCTPVASRRERTLIYLGTLTPRFDTELCHRVLSALSGWRLEIVGGCLYPGYGDAPPPELDRLLSLGGRVRWHGPMPRREALGLLDRATVSIVPNDPTRSLGQDSMKFYDYAARGLPIVSTPWFDPASSDVPPHLLVAATPDQFAQAVLRASEQTDAQASQRRRWAAARTWSSRWPAWAQAVFADA